MTFLYLLNSGDTIKQGVHKFKQMFSEIDIKYNILKHSYQKIFQYWKMDWKFDYGERVNKVKYQLQLGCQVDLDWTLFRDLLLVRILHYAVQGQKETANIQVWCSNIWVGNLKVGCYLMTIGYYTRHKNVRKQLTFKLATSIME